MLANACIFLDFSYIIETLPLLNRIYNQSIFINGVQKRSSKTDNQMDNQMTAITTDKQPEEIPARVLDRLTTAVKTIEKVNEEILRLRELGRKFGQGGRYEYEFRTYGLEDRTRYANMIINEFIHIAPQKGIDPFKILASLGNHTVLPESPESKEWRRP
ncbi:MAG: hypothetical protein AB1489_27160 [Acidobacteriota bacterium]